MAERDEQALTAVRLLDAEWAPAEATPMKPIDLVLRRDDGVDAALAGRTLRLDARYHVPHIAHASIGPNASVADVRADGADLYVATQRPFAMRDAVAGLFQLPPDKVHVHPQVMGGMYGRGNAGDSAIEAARAVSRGWPSGPGAMDARGGVSVEPVPSHAGCGTARRPR